jgi:hypothetical protein
MAELPVSAPAALEAHVEVAAEPTEDDLRTYVGNVLEGNAVDFYSWCEGEGLNWQVIARMALKSRIENADDFWAGAARYHENKVKA